MYSSKISISFAVFLLSVVPSLGQEPGEGSEEPVSTVNAVTISGAVALTKKGGDAFTFLQGSLDLGQLRCGQAYILNLKLCNTSDLDIETDSVYTGCKCRSFKLEERLIASGEAVDAQLVFKTPLNPETISYTIGGELRLSGKPVAVVGCSCQLEGVLRASAGTLLLDYDDLQERVFRTPFIFTSPVSKEHLVTKVSDSLTDFLSARVTILDQTSGFIEVQLKSDASLKENAGTVVGSVTLQETVLDKEQEISVLLSKSKLVTISPSLLRFKKADGKISARAIAKVKRIDESLSDPVFSAIINSEQLLVTAKKLNDSIYRLEVEMNPDIVDQVDIDKLTWSISTGATTSVLPSKFLILGLEK